MSVCAAQKPLILTSKPCRGKMGVADARIIDLEEQKAQLEEAKAAAEAASKEAFALREKQTERIKRTKAGGPAGESAFIPLPLLLFFLPLPFTLFFLPLPPPPLPLPPFRQSIFFLFGLMPCDWCSNWVLLLLQSVSARLAALCRSQMSSVIRNQGWGFLPLPACLPLTGIADENNCASSCCMWCRACWLCYSIQNQDQASCTHLLSCCNLPRAPLCTSSRQQNKFFSCLLGVCSACLQ